MKQRLIVTRMQSELTKGKPKIVTALLEGGRLLEAWAEDPAQEHPETEKEALKPENVHPGGIYIARIQRVLPDLHAAFAEIQPGLACFLPLDQLYHPVFTKRIHENEITPNDELLVQVSRGAKGTKAPSVTTNIHLKGRYLIVTSGDYRLGISAKLPKQEREAFKEMLQPLLPKNLGLIVRTNARYAAPQELQAELKILVQRWNRIYETAPSRICFSCIQSSDPAWLEAIRNLDPALLSDIETDLPAVYEALCEYAKPYHDLCAIPIRLYEDSSWPLAAAAGLNPAIEKILRRKVWLESGGFLLIEPTETLTAIDVNSGKNTGRKQKHRKMKKAGTNRAGTTESGSESEDRDHPERDFYLQANLEAAREIALQLRARNLSGMILVDFINMDSDKKYDILMKQFNSCLKQDRVLAQVEDRTRLGLIEVTRKKTGQTFFEQLTS